MKAIITLLSGFLGVLFLEGFSRLIISFYHRLEFSFLGVSHLPADVWIYVIFFSVLISTWLSAMLVLTIMKFDSKKYALFFGAILVCWRGFEVFNSFQSEPLYYFITVIGLHITGVYLAYVAYSKQKDIR